MEYRIISAPGTAAEHIFTQAALWHLDIHTPLISGDIGVGFCPTSYITVKLSQGDALIPRMAELQLQGRETAAEVWQPLGTYWVGKRSKSELGRLTITAYNAMRKAQQDWAPLTKITVWPAPMGDVVKDIADILGVSIDPRTALEAGTDYMVPSPFQSTADASDGSLLMQEVLSWIAAAHGGNFFVTYDNTLYLAPLTPAADTVTRDIGAKCSKLSHGADPLTISRVTVWRTREVGYTVGDDTGYALELDCPYATGAICDDLAAKLCGYTYVPFSAERAAVPMATQPGDLVRIKDQTYYIAGMDIRCGAMFLADLQAPAAPETDDEFPVQDTAGRQQERAWAAKIPGKIDQTLDQQMVFNKLTNNGQAQGIFLKDGNLYIHASFIAAGVIRSTDFLAVPVDQIFPGEDAYPGEDVYPNYGGEKILRGMEIDFQTGVIRGVFWSEVTDALNQRVTALEAALAAPETE